MSQETGENGDIRPSSSTSNTRNKKKPSKRRKPVKNTEPTLEGLGGEYGWIARGDRHPEEKRVPFTRPTVKQIYNALPFIWRYSFFWLKNFRQREKLFINTFQPLKHRPYYGVPCGGIGAGSIGRDFRGAFVKFSLRPGFVEQRADSVKADQFILNISKDGKTLRQIVLSAAYSGNDSPLAAWDFSFPAENIAYRGLYPRSWTRYDIAEFNMSVVCRQITPVIPHDYKDSSLPASVFVFDVINNSAESYDVSITFTFRNGTGKRRAVDDQTCSTKEFEQNQCKGVLLEQKIDQMDCIYALSATNTAENNTSVCTGFDPNGNGKVFWTRLHDSAGKIDGKLEASNNGVAVSSSTRVESNGGRGKLEFSLIWHMPTVFFGTRSRPMRRWYAKHFGSDKESAVTISEYSLNTYPEWERKIDEWQNPVLQHPNLPNWFKSALFNELYFLSDGGSVWFDFDESWISQEKHMSDYTAKLLTEYGRFGYLESWEYRMYCTFDVHFYASFALAELFPQLEHVLQAEMTDNIHNTEDTLVKYHMEGDIAPIKTYGRVPHDLGNPACEPWISTNVYQMHNTSLWKDLNLKYILTSYRDYYCMLKKSRTFLEFTWPTVKSLIEVGLKAWDLDGDGMIENFGLADQTYDAWKMEGISSYCGSLWIAALRVTVEMAKDIEDAESVVKYSSILDKAKKVFDDKLWNGKYYNFDESQASQKTIMADQLCGYWYLQSIDPNLVKDLLPREHVKSSLATVYDFNVVKFGAGRLGAVNGMKPDGKVDRAYIQADEVWTGITYALGAFFIQEGEPQKGFDVAWGIYDTCFNRSGLQYQTPEAIYRKRYYRAIGYMRPLCIWSMYSALRKGYKLGGKESELLAGIKITDPAPKMPAAESDEASSDSEMVDPAVIAAVQIAEVETAATVLRPPSPVTVDTTTKIVACA